MRLTGKWSGHLTSIALIVLLLTSPALARVPAAVVIEVGSFSEHETPARCKGIQLYGGEIFISQQLADQVRGTVELEQNIHIEAGLTQSEEITRIVLRRSSDACDIFLAAKRLPLAETVFRKSSGSDYTWRIDSADSVLHVGTDSQSFSLAAGQEHVPETSGTVHLFNYGRLALWQGSLKLEVMQLNVEASYSGHFDGPGAEAHFFINIPEAGTLGIVLPARLKSVVDIKLSRLGRTFPWRTGSRKYFDRPSKALLVLRYNGFGPADFRLKLPFATRQIAVAKLTCTLESGGKVNDKYPVQLRLTNTAHWHTEVFKLTPQTVKYYPHGQGDGGGERWERPPEKIILFAGDSITQAFGSMEKSELKGSYATVRIPDKSGRDRVIKCPVDGVGKNAWSWTELFGGPKLELDVVSAMIKGGVDVNKPERFGRNKMMTYPLAMVLSNTGRSLQIAKMLIKAGAKIDQGDEQGKTALHIAARFGYARFAAMLIKHGGNVDVKDKIGQTPLCDAAYSGSGDVTTLLLKSGADVKARDNEGRSPLHLLQYTSFTPDPLSVARLLLGAGADVNARSDKHGTPLHQAAKHENTELATMLIANGADTNATDSAGNTPAHIAAAYNRTEILVLLKSAGAALDGFNKAHETPLHKAAENVSLKATAWLLDHGANIEARSNSDMTPLLLASITASASKKPSMIKLLLKHGAKIDVQDDQGNTPLSFAEKLNSEVYKILKEAKKRRTANERK